MDLNRVMVSIVTPSYNCSKYIAKTIESVTRQSYQNWEMIIVDDCSIDNSVEVIERIVGDNPKIRLIKLEHNVGSAQSRNAALEVTSGRFIAFLDSDDIWYTDKLEKQVEFMLKRKAPISFTSYELIDENGASKNHIIHSVEKITQIDYLKNTIIGFSTSMIDIEMVGDNFRMRDIRTRQDASLWITLLGKGFIAQGIDEVLMKYRVHSQSISANKVKAAKQVWNLYFNLHRLGLLKSMYYFSFYVFNAIKKRINFF
jgi:teichuronic acid biosynthesis glycosyltransferase TuaG